MSLVFLCGPHGSGKTTLAERLQTFSSDIFIPELKTQTVKLHTNPYERIMLKTCERALENYEATVIATENPEKIVLGNRCIYDAYAYAAAYRECGWITDAQYDRVIAVAREAFPAMLLQPRALVLNPSFETVWSRLQGRWKQTEKKWQEEDAAYSKAACAAYNTFVNQPQILYVQDNALTPQLLTWLKIEKLSQRAA
jgi:deoxyadenosine/deoxycytidine kinase